MTHACMHVHIQPAFTLSKVFLFFSQHNSTAGVTGETSTAGKEGKKESCERHLGLN